MSQKNKIRKLFTKNIVEIAKALETLNMPGKVLATAGVQAGTIEVGEGNILRIQTSGDMFVSFGDQSAPAVPSVTSPVAVKLVGAGVHYVICQCAFARISTAASRIELLEL